MTTEECLKGLAPSAKAQVSSTHGMMMGGWEGCTKGGGGQCDHAQSKREGYPFLAVD